MRLASVEVIPYALPFREPYVTARGTLTRREMVLLRLRDEDGLVGLGEAVPLSLRGGASIEQVVEELEGLARGSCSPPPSRAATSARRPGCRRAGALRARPLRGADRAARPRREARGVDAGAVSPVPCNATLVAGEPAAVADDALRWAAEGYTTFKLKLGAGEDVAQVRAVREALGAGGPDPRRRQRDLGPGRRRGPSLGELEPLGIQLAEQPVATMERAVELAASTSIPLAGDESVETPEDAAARRPHRRLPADRDQALEGRRADGGAADRGQPPRLRVERPRRPGRDRPRGAPGGQAAPAALAGSGERAHGLATQRLFASTIASVECELRDGILHPPAGPGLGVEIDEEALQAHRL